MANARLANHVRKVSEYGGMTPLVALDMKGRPDWPVGPIRTEPDWTSQTQAETDTNQSDQIPP